MARGGARVGAGRKSKAYWDKVRSMQHQSGVIAETQTAQPDSVPKHPPSLERMVAQALGGNGANAVDVKRLAHKVAYMEQEVEFIKKIILAEIEANSK